MAMNGSRNVSEKKNPPKGRYANILRVGYNAFEFVFDFGQAFSDNESTQSCMRIVTSPGHAKAMILALEKAMEAFECDFGRIASEGDSTAGQDAPIKNNP
jgi:hypothetical protein